MSYKPNLAAHMPAAALNAAGSIHSPSTSMAASSQYRQLLSDYGPPSLGYTQEEKQARARERDRLKKRRRREDGLRRSLERQRNALAMLRRRREKREARRQLRQEAGRPGQASRPGGEAREQRRQKREEEARALQRELAALVPPRAEKAQEEEWPEPGASLLWGTGNSQVPQSKYAELLAIIEELGKEIRPTYAGSKSAMERLKRGIIHARGLVRECLAETERNARS